MVTPWDTLDQDFLIFMLRNQQFPLNQIASNWWPIATAWNPTVTCLGRLLGISAVVTMSFANTLDIGHEQCSWAHHVRRLPIIGYQPAWASFLRGSATKTPLLNSKVKWEKAAPITAWAPYLGPCEFQNIMWRYVKPVALPSSSSRLTKPALEVSLGRSWNANPTGVDLITDGLVLPDTHGLTLSTDADWCISPKSLHKLSGHILLATWDQKKVVQLTTRVTRGTRGSIGYAPGH